VRYVLDPAKFGTLSNFRGVDFLPQQALLHAPAGSALSEQQFALGTAASIVELRFVTALMGAVDVPQGTPVAEVELRDASNRAVATAELVAGRDTMDWAWAAPSVQAAVKHQQAEVAAQTTENGGPEPHSRDLSFADFAFSTPVSAQSIVVRATPPAGEFVLYGAAAVGSDGTLTQLFGKTKTKYREVYADNEIRVLEDTAAYPRAFVVPRARVAASLGTTLNEMVHQPFHPDQEVILAGDTPQLPGSATDRGGSGTAQVVAYAPDNVRVHTSASADAWLVLSDAYYPGWSATVDGRSAPVLRGDLLFRAVPIPAGEHEVEFRFAPSSVSTGLAISLISLVLVVGTLILAGGRGWRGRTT
jgi:hypothetical protein